MTGSKSLAGLIAAAGYLPALVLGLLLGSLVDFGDRRRLMMIADILRAVVLIYIPIAFTGGWLTPWQLALAAFLISTGATLFNPARDATIPKLVLPDNLLPANALVQTTAHVSLLSGPMIAGVILAFTSLTGLFYFNTAAYIISLLTIFLLRIPPRETLGKAAQPIKAVIEALKFAVKEKWSGELLLLSALDNLLIMGPAIVGIPIIVREELGLGPQAFAAIHACHGVGMLIGALLLGSLGKNLPKGKVILVAIIFDGLTFIPIFWAPDIYWLGAIFMFHSIGIPFIMIPRTAMIQESIPANMQGRFFALVNLTVVGMMALSTAMTGIACEWIGIRWVYVVIGTAGAACGLFGFLLRDLSMKR